jgi:hypothetical protein
MVDVKINPDGGEITLKIKFNGVFNAGWSFELYPPEITGSNTPILKKSGNLIEPEPYQYILPDSPDLNIGRVMNFVFSYNNKGIKNADIKGSIIIIFTQNEVDIVGDTIPLDNITEDNQSINLGIKLIKKDEK